MRLLASVAQMPLGVVDSTDQPEVVCGSCSLSVTFFATVPGAPDTLTVILNLMVSPAETGFGVSYSALLTVTSGQLTTMFSPSVAEPSLVVVTWR